MSFTLRILGWVGGTIDLTPGTTGLCTMDTWRPRTAVRTNSSTGAIFADVSESIPLRMATLGGSNVFGKMDEISGALDQAARWNNRDGVDAVLLEYEPSGSDLGEPVLCPIMGGTVNVGDGFQILQAAGTVLGAIQLTRKPVWVEETEEEKDSGDAVSQPTVDTISVFTESAHVPSPTEIEMDFETISANGEAVLAVSNDSSNLLVLRASGMDNGGYYSSLAAASDSGGTILKFTDNTASSPAGRVTDSLDITAFNSDSRRISIYISTRYTAGDRFYVKARVWEALTGVGGTPSYGYNDTEVRKLPGSTSREWQYLGTVAITEAAQGIALVIYNSGVNTGAGLEMNQLVLIAADNESTYAVASSVSSTPSQEFSLIASPEYTTYPDPSFNYRKDGGSDEFGISFTGSPSFWMTGDIVSTVFMANYSNLWRGGSAFTIARRQRGHITPGGAQQ